MARKHHKPEEIVAKLRQVEVLVGQDKPVADAVRTIGVTEASSATEFWPISADGFWPTPRPPTYVALIESGDLCGLERQSGFVRATSSGA
jgi:hypothetical protein